MYIIYHGFCFVLNNIGVFMNRKDLIEELHKLKEAITLVSDRVNEIDEDLISCGTNTDNMKKYIATCIDDLYAANTNLTKAITNLHISKALYEK